MFMICIKFINDVIGVIHNYTKYKSDVVPSTFHVRVLMIISIKFLEIV